MVVSKLFLTFLILIHVFQVLVAQNYDESKIESYQLPELLVTKAGKKITTIADWEKIRRPELLKLFEDHVYGQVPHDFDDIRFKVTNQNNNAMNGKATLKEVDITVTRKQKAVTINLVMFTPNKVRKPVPVFLTINHRGHKTMDVTRQNKDGFWPAEEVIDAGYAIAGFDVADVAPDNNDHFTEGILAKLYPEQLEKENGMRALGAWGWGSSRAIDWFVKDKDVDASKVISVGHSRGGKASLWLGAQDKRVAITVSNESGNTGAAISRRNFGETMERITTNFPYWFATSYRQYAGNEDKLPIDQHMLMALIAPRAVYIASAAEDLWADPKGQYLALKEAQPVFELYGAEACLPENMPEVNTQIICRNTGFHNREGKHNMTPFDWQQFIGFANKYFNLP
jgi:hypothetical protein